MKTRKLLAVLVMAASMLGTAHGEGNKLRKETLDAWDLYVAAAKDHMAARAAGKQPFLWADEVPGRSQRIMQGEIVVAPVVNEGSKSIPHGLIHDWVGAIFIPNTSIDKVAATLREYGRYKEYFPPTVVDSKVLQRNDQEDHYDVRWINKVLFVNAAIDAECRTQYVHIDDHHVYSTSYAYTLQEIEDYGHPTEHDLPAGSGHGYVWRLYSFARYEQRDGGVYLEIEAIALTRDIPLGLRFMVVPEVQKLSRRSLFVSLEQSRAAILLPPTAVPSTTPNVSRAPSMRPAANSFSSPR